MSRRWVPPVAVAPRRATLFLRRHAGVEGIDAAVPDGVPRWRAHARRLYATVTDRVRVAAALLASRMARGRLASPFTAREVYRNDWTGLTEPRVVGEALECLRELGWIRPEAAVARDGGRPTVRFHINPRVAPR
jgi:hypothetical protein